MKRKSGCAMMVMVFYLLDIKYSVILILRNVSLWYS